MKRGEKMKDIMSQYIIIQCGATAEMKSTGLSDNRPSVACLQELMQQFKNETCGMTHLNVCTSVFNQYALKHGVFRRQDFEFHLKCLLKSSKLLILSKCDVQIHLSKMLQCTLSHNFDFLS